MSGFILVMSEWVDQLGFFLFEEDPLHESSEGEEQPLLPAPMRSVQVLLLLGCKSSLCLSLRQSQRAACPTFCSSFFTQPLLLSPSMHPGLVSG